MMSNLFPLLVIVVVLFVVLNLSAGLIWVERRLLALWQDRYGPNRVGPFGLGQVIADMIKLFTKEDWIPPFRGQAGLCPGARHRHGHRADVVRSHSIRSRIVLPTSTSACSSSSLCRPWALTASCSRDGPPTINTRCWAACAAAAQMMSYEVFMGLSLMGVVMLAGSFHLKAIVEAQRAAMVRDSSIPRLRYLFHCRRCRNAPAALRSCPKRKANWSRASIPNTPG